MILIVVSKEEDVETLRRAFGYPGGTHDGEFHVSFFGQLNTGYSYDAIIVRHPEDAEEGRYIDEVLVTSLNPGGKIIYL